MWLKLADTISGKKNYIWVLLIIACLIGVWFSNWACAEQSYISYDYTESPEQYAQMVATLNASQGTEDLFLRKSAEREQLCAVLCKTNGRGLSVITEGLAYKINGPGNCYTLYYHSKVDAEGAIEYYHSQSGMVYAEMDSEVRAAVLLSREEGLHTFHSWGAVAMNYGRYMAHARGWGNGTSVVAVIDSGVFRHALLDGKMGESGFDYIDVDDDSTNDLYGHGTHVAGIIADCTGELPVYIYPIRVLNAAGKGKMSNVVNAVAEACEKKVDVINLSLESFVMSEALDTAILEAVSKGITVVVAAGNSRSDTEYVCPAHLRDRGVIVVGAAELNGGSCVRAPYSNYGESVDVYAFGTNIVSCSRSGGFVEETGTSMAAPHISALCALTRLIHHGISPAEQERRVISGAVTRGEVNIMEATQMIPASPGFSLRALSLRVGEALPLPEAALPVSCCEPLRYESANPTVASVADGRLTALQPGSTIVKASCVGLDVEPFQLIVMERSMDGYALFPKNLKRVEDEAYAGDQVLEWIRLPQGLETIGDRVFDDCGALRLIELPDSLCKLGENTFSNAVLLCGRDSYAQGYAEEHGLQYIAIRFTF